MSDMLPLPQDRFGFSQQRYNLPPVPTGLPNRDALIAANNLNDHRFYGLTAKQRLFIDEYFRNGFDATKAALAAGWATTDHEARKIGRALLRKAYIAKAIDLAFAYYGEATKVNLPAVINEINNIAFSNMGDYFTVGPDGDPRVCMPSDDERQKLAALSEIQVETYMEGRGRDSREVKRIKFKTYNKLDALEKLLKIAGVRGVANEPAAAPNVKVDVDASTVTNVSVINLVPVPHGQFIPAPERAENSTPLIEHSPLIDVVIKDTAPA